MMREKKFVATLQVVRSEFSLGHRDRGRAEPRMPTAIWASQGKPPAHIRHSFGVGRESLPDGMAVLRSSAGLDPGSLPALLSDC